MQTRNDEKESLMFKKSALCVVAVLALLAFTLPDLADAKRMGGGRSFGNQKSFSQPAQRPAQERGSQSGQQQQQGQQQGVQQQGSAARPMGGMMGGMLGGLLMGGLLGSLLFGGGFGGIGIFEILLVGGGLFLLFRFLRSRQAATQAAGAGAPAGYAGGMQRAETPAPAPGGWGSLHRAPARPQDAAPAGPTLPPGFDADEFLEGAKLVYARLQESWDKRDLEDIRSFSVPEVYEEIALQAQDDPGPSNTEILMINARLLEAKEQNGELLATVYYDCLLRESADASNPSQVREVWHYSKPAGDKAAQWKLAGIQQLEE